MVLQHLREFGSFIYVGGEPKNGDMEYATQSGTRSTGSERHDALLTLPCAGITIVMHRFITSRAAAHWGGNSG